MKPTVIYEDGNHVHVAATVIYAGANNKFFYDAAKTEAGEIPAEDIFELFVNGVLVVSDGKYVRPIACTKAGVLTLPTIA